ncbi:putative F-box domain, leucine-rich repeat domain superfamily, F-box-like domain superfamily [Helianthus annuus]|nr:putative F-box domain, leucine-rich repeat domain superfamily, F-box-like domain superfamily [Helianthus annuus]
MQKLASYSGEGDFSLGKSMFQNPIESGIFSSLGHHAEVYALPCKRSRVNAPFVFNEEVYKKQKTTIEVLPDECLFEIFRCLDGNQERSSCASVSKRWLMLVTEKGFWVMGHGQGLQKLRSLTVASCLGLTDIGVEAVGKGCPNLKQFSLRKCAFLSDNGLFSFAKSSISLESLLLEECHRVTQCGILSMLVNHDTKLKSLTLKNCLGFKDLSFKIPSSRCNTLKTLSVHNCPGFGNGSLMSFGQLCPELQHVELTGLHGITDSGFTPLINCCEAGLVKVNISGCINVTDNVVCEMSKVHGGTLESLNLNGCRSVTDASMVAVASNCLLLNELDVSECGITDFGISALARAVQLNLNVLSVSGCRLVTDKSLPFLLKIGGSLVGLNIQHCHGISNSSVGLLVDRLGNCDILS